VFCCAKCWLFLLRKLRKLWCTVSTVGSRKLQVVVASWMFWWATMLKGCGVKQMY